MAQDSKIEWTQHTGNLWWGCVAVHAGCDHCYAEAHAKRYKKDVWGARQPRLVVKSFEKDIASYQRLAAAAGRVDRVFVGSMMDIFEKPAPLADWNGNALPGTTEELRQPFFHQVVPACPNLDFLLLTKRPGNIPKYVPPAWLTAPRANVMYGTSIVDQPTHDLLLPQLLAVPGRRFLSMEPLLGPVRLDLHALGQLDWVIVGGESGPHARAMNPAWVRSIQQQCGEAGVPFFFKQAGVQLAKTWGCQHHKGAELSEIPAEFQLRVFPSPIVN